MHWIRLKRLLLFFWAMWLMCVVATNLADALTSSGVLAEGFPFASGNYHAILKVVAPFGLSHEAAGLLFAAVILWEIVAALLFGHLALTFRGLRAGSAKPLVTTFAVALSLWGALQIACEAFPSLFAFQVESTHRGLFTAQLTTLLAIVLLPEADALDRDK